MGTPVGELREGLEEQRGFNTLGRTMSAGQTTKCSQGLDHQLRSVHPWLQIYKQQRMALSDIMVREALGPAEV